ncbi:MAG: ABC transporter [Actinobacteria bacterium]|nr:MAG: ABC transporter [Actinomycetota bacterium]
MIVGRLAPVALAVLLAACGGGASSAPGGGGGALRVSGSTTVNPVAADAADVLRREGLRVTVDTQGGSAGGIVQLAAGQIEIAMSSKEVSEDDRKAHPSVDFVATEIGADAVGVVVRKEVFDGGVRSLTRDQLKAVFEGRVANWSELGGPDLPVFVYDKEPGRGTREVLDKYLYGKGGKAPPPPRSDNYAIVGGNEEARAKLLSTPGSVGPLSSAFVADRPELVAVAIEGVTPTSEHIRDGSYPMSRPLFLVTDGKPAGPAERFVDFVVSAPGQQLLTRHGYLTLAELG